jgi:hypothetical protein
MKTILICILLAFASASSAQLPVAALNSFASGPDIIKAAPGLETGRWKKMQNNYISLYWLGTTRYWGNGESGNMSNAFANLEYARLLAGNDKMFFINGLTPFLDDARRGYGSDDHPAYAVRMRRLYADGVYAQKIVEWFVTKKWKFHMRADKQDKKGYVVLNVYTIQPRIERQLSARGGISYINRGIFHSRIEKKVQDENPESPFIYTLYGTRSIAVSTGVSISRFISYRYKRNLCYLFANTYADLLISTGNQNFASSKNTLTGEVVSGQLAEFKNASNNPLGFRVGMNRRISNAKIGWLGKSMGIEYGRLPGLNSGSSYVIIKIGACFGF